MLRLEQVNGYYGNVQALNKVSLEVAEGEIVALIGANGAGKTTVLHTISGLIQRCDGQIEFQGRRIDGLPAARIAALGIAHVPEGRRVFPGLTVRENLEMGACSWRSWRHLSSRDLAREMQLVFHLFPVLEERCEQVAWSLSGGEQQMLAIGRGLMARPKLLMLDEPSLGLAPMLVQDLFARVCDINRQGCTILLAEQNAYMALNVSHRAYVLETGSVVLDGPTEEIRANEGVRQAYLGG